MRYWNRRRQSTKVAITAIVTTLYAVLTIVLGDLAFAWIQIRVSDALIPLSTVFGWPVVIGVALGCIVANFFSPIGLIDYIMGPLANLIASLVSYAIRRNKHAACLLPAGIISLVVSTYVSGFYGVPFLLCLATIFAGEFISCYIIGLPILLAVKRIMEG